jgi:hypothetical protein
MACSGIHITIQKSLEWAFCVPLSCLLVVHKSLCASGAVHSARIYFFFGLRACVLQFL